MRCFVAFLLAVQITSGATLMWDPNPEPEVTGYNVYWGTASRSYTTVIDVGNSTSWVITNVPVIGRIYFAVTAYTADRIESPFSEEVVWVRPPSAPRFPRITGTNQTVTIEFSPTVSGGDWQKVTVPATNSAGFFRLRVVDSQSPMVAEKSQVNLKRKHRGVQHKGQLTTLIK